MGSNPPKTQIGDLHSVVGRSSNRTVHQWVLEQVHFHWGRTSRDDEGSEHYLKVFAFVSA